MQYTSKEVFEPKFSEDIARMTIDDKPIEDILVMLMRQSDDHERNISELQKQVALLEYKNRDLEKQLHFGRMEK